MSISLEMFCHSPNMTIEARGISPGDSWAFTTHRNMQQIMEMEMSKTIKIHQIFTKKMQDAFFSGDKFEANQSVINMFFMAERYDPKNNSHPPAIIPAEPTEEMITAFYKHLSFVKSDDLEGAFKAALKAALKAAPEPPEGA